MFCDNINSFENSKSDPLLATITNFVIKIYEI